MKHHDGRQALAEIVSQSRRRVFVRLFVSRGADGAAATATRSPNLLAETSQERVGRIRP